jgi:hypothetical protein
LENNEERTRFLRSSGRKEKPEMHTIYMSVKREERGKA